MIKEINEELMDMAIDFAWELTRDPKNSSYPVIKNKSDFENGFKRCLKEEEQVLLGAFEGDKLIGVFNYFYIEKEKYVQSKTVCIIKDYGKVMDEFLSFISKDFKDYEILCGFPKENINAMKYFEGLNAEILDSCLDMRLNLEDFKPSEVDKNVHIASMEEFKGSASLHDKYFQGAYWNSTRILEDFENWRIFVYEKDKTIKGELFMKAKTYKDKSLEVFGVKASEDSKGTDIEKALLSEGLKNGIKENKEISEIICFVEDTEEGLLEGVKEVGFHYSGSYRCFKICF